MNWTPGPARCPDNASPALRRAFKRIEVSDSGCWLWKGYVGANGYGRTTNNLGKGMVAHRLFYTELRGEIPAGLVIDHLCRVRNCVNPAHLEPVTHSQNMRRSPLLGTANRKKTHCPKGHPYSGDNLLLRKNGHRDCRACNRVMAKNQDKTMREARRKLADHAAFVAQVREVVEGMLCAPDCDSRKPGHMVGGISFDVNAPPKVREVKHKCTCPRGKLLALCEVCNG